MKDYDWGSIDWDSDTIKVSLHTGPPGEGAEPVGGYARVRPPSRWQCWMRRLLRRPIPSPELTWTSPESCTVTHAMIDGKVFEVGSGNMVGTDPVFHIGPDGGSLSVTPPDDAETAPQPEG